MKLNEYLKSIGEGPYAWASKHNLPGTRINDHCKYEIDPSRGRPLGPNLSISVVIASGGKVTLEDLLPDLSKKIDTARRLEIEAINRAS